jgi:hypothetical protein
MQDRTDDLVPDVLEYEDFKLARSAIIAGVVKRLRSDYTPSSLLTMDSPKGDLMLRAGSVPEIDDRLVYTAIAGALADRIDAVLEPESVVPSYRVRVGKRDEYLFKMPIPQWFASQDLIRRGYEDGFRFLLKTDLTAYFDHVDHEILLGELKDVGASRTICKLLESLLEHWFRRKRGLPQGIEPSSLLGNFYLHPMDKHMVRAGFRYFRYMDDIYVFGRSKAEIKRAATELTRETRKLGLHLQSAKTRVVEGAAILDLVNERRAAFDAVAYDMSTGRPELAVTAIRRILHQLLGPGPFNERHFRKCLIELRKMGHAAAVPDTLKRLDEFASSADQIARYLRPFVRSHPTVKRDVMAYLLDPDRNIHEWPEYWFSGILLRTHSLPRQFLDWARSRLQSSECHWACRAQYAMLLGIHGDIADKSLVQSMVQSRSHDYERRGFIIALAHLPNPERAKVFRELQRDFPDLEPTIKLARARNQLS